MCVVCGRTFSDNGHGAGPAVCRRNTGGGPARDPGSMSVGASHHPRGGRVLGKAAGFCGSQSSEEGMWPGGPETPFSERAGERAALFAA
jgi:hypothetical protein